MGKSDMALFYAGVLLCEIVNAHGFYFTYLFIFGCDGSSLLLRLSLESEGYSLAEVRLLFMVVSFVAEHRPQGPRASVVAAHGLSCPMAYGISLNQGSNLCPLHWQVDS